MRYCNTILSILIFCITGYVTQAQNIQRYNIFNYSVNEGLLQTTISDIAFDKNNFCWISFPNGIQKFDGKDFTRVPIQPGLPDDKLSLFFRCNNGDLLISHSEGISKYDIIQNRFKQVYTIPDKKIAAQFIGQDGNIIYCYTTTDNIIGMDCNTFKIVSIVNTGFNVSAKKEARPKISDNIINHKVAFAIESSIYLWDLQKAKLISQSPVFEHLSFYLLALKTESEVLFHEYNYNNAIQLYNFTSGIKKTLVIKGKDDKSIGRCIIYPWKNKILISFSNKLYETDTTFQVLKTELVNYQNQPFSGNIAISRIKEDNYGNLCLSTVNGGIRKVIRYNYPIKYYGTEDKGKNNVLCVMPDKNENRILVGTAGNGLLIFDTLQRLVKKITSLPGAVTQPLAVNIIIKTTKESYLLFVVGENKVWQLSNDLSRVDPISITTSLPGNKSGPHYFGNFLFQDENKAIVQTQGRIYQADFNTGTITEIQFTDSYCMGALFCNNFIISHANDELIYLDAVTFKESKRIPFKNTSYVRCFAKDQNNNIYIGSNNGIFKIDENGKIVLHLKIEDGLPDDCIYAMVFDNEGFLWCSTNKGIFRLNSNNSILQLKKEDGLQENEFNTNAVAKTMDGEIFFAGVNGVSSFYPDAINKFEEKIMLLVTKIKVNNEDAFKDTAVWNIEKLDLPYYQNSLSFDFIAMANNNPGQYIYQYKMEGADDQWIQNNEMQTVRYRLQPGKYTLKIYASRLFNKDAMPMKEIMIIIHPPFWKTWWFLAGLLLIILSLTAYIINSYNKRKYLKKLLLLENEKNVQQERERISRDLHDNIGAYANAVLYNTELLEKEQEKPLRETLMKDLKFASKDIITSLRETIWALKKETYTAEDCMLRIKNFVQPFTRYYPHIHFEIEGELPKNKTLHYTKALNLVRIVQEAVTNAIKHTNAGLISIESNTKNDFWEIVVTDNGKGFDAVLQEQAAQGNGLTNMRQRAIDAGFDLTIRSLPGTGTSVIVRIKEVHIAS